jgi:hypothetical protein
MRVAENDGGSLAGKPASSMSSIQFQIALVEPFRFRSAVLASVVKGEGLGARFPHCCHPEEGAVPTRMRPIGAMRGSTARPAGIAASKFRIVESEDPGPKAECLGSRG